MTDVAARRAIALAGVSLVVVVVSLSVALVTPGPLATAVTLAAMIALGVSLHAIGRTHPGH